MTTKAIKISSENYQWLLRIAAELKKRTGTSISLDNALKFIKNKEEKKGTAEALLKFAGAWKMSDEEAEVLSRTLRNGWKKWTTRYA